MDRKIDSQSERLTVSIINIYYIIAVVQTIAVTGKPYLRVMLSTVDLLVLLTNIKQLFLYIKYYLPMLQNKLP